MVTRLLVVLLLSLPASADLLCSELSKASEPVRSSLRKAQEAVNAWDPVTLESALDQLGGRIPAEFEGELNSQLGMMLESKEPRRAVLAYQKAVKFLQGRPLAVARFDLSVTLMRMGRYPKALEQLKLALPDHPDAGEIWMQIGSCYGYQGELDSRSRPFPKPYS